MARRIEVEVIVDPDQAQRGFRQAGHAAQVFEKDLGKSARGAVAASLSFRGLGRAASYASGYLLAGGGLVVGLKAASKAAIDHQATQAQLAAAVKNSGVNFGTYRDQIEATLKSQRNLAGFTEEDTNKSFTRLLRTTKDVGRALTDNALAMRIARGAGISLNTASNIVNKTLAGQTTGLRRLGVELPKGVSGYRALQIANQKYAGSVTAYSRTAAGAQQRLSNALHETEVTVGTALLPTITRLSTELANWLGKSKNQERVQRDVTQAVRFGSAAIRDITRFTKMASSAVGGFKNAAELLLALKFASMITRWSGALTGFQRQAGAARTAAGLLRGSLLKLGAIGVITVGVEVLIHRKQIDKAVTGFLDKHGLSGISGSNNLKGLNAGNVDAAIAAARKAGDSFTTGILRKAKALLDAQAAAAPSTPRATGDRVNPRSNVPGSPSYVAPAPRGTSNSSSGGSLDRLSEIQNQVQAARTASARGQSGAQAHLVAALKDEIDYDRRYEQIQEKLVARGGKDAKRHAEILRGLQADEASALGEITAMNDAHATARDNAARAAAAAAKTHAAAARKQEAASRSKANRSFLQREGLGYQKARITPGLDDDLAALNKEVRDIRARIRQHGSNLGLEKALTTARQRISAINQKQATFAEPFALLLAQAKAATTATTKDDRRVATQMKRFAERMIRSGKLKGQAFLDAWNEIAAQNSVLANQASTQTRKVSQQVVQASSRVLTANLNLTHGQRVALEQRIAQAEAHSGHIPAGTGALGINIGTLHMHGVNDPKKFLNDLQKEAKRNSGQTRGRHPGTYLGLH